MALVCKPARTSGTSRNPSLSVGVIGTDVAFGLGMMLARIPSLQALESDDNDRLAQELRLGRLRAQVAIVRALADAVEHLARPGDTDGLGNQVIEEMARLGCRLLEAAEALPRSPCPEDSGVFALGPETLLARNR